MANLQLKCISFGMAFVQSRNLCEVRSLTFAPILVPVLGVMFHVVIVKAPPHVFGPKNHQTLKLLAKLPPSCGALPNEKPGGARSIDVASPWWLPFASEGGRPLRTSSELRDESSIGFHGRREWDCYGARMGRRPQSLSLKGENDSAIDASKLSLGRLFMSFTLLLQISAEHFRNLEKKLQLYCIHSIYRIYVYMYVYAMTIDRLV